jgi:hypothetical protein
MAIRRLVIKGIKPCFSQVDIFNQLKTVAMKKLIITLFFGGFMILFGAPHACATGSNTESAILESVKTEVTKQIPYPAFALTDKLSGTVEILFHVNDNGEIHVVRVISKEAQLGQYVKQQLEGKLLDLPVQGQTYQMTVDYVQR